MTPGEIIGVAALISVASCGGCYGIGLKIGRRTTKANGNGNGKVVMHKPLADEFVQHPICKLRQEVCVQKLGRKLDAMMNHFKIPIPREADDKPEIFPDI